MKADLVSDAELRSFGERLAATRAIDAFAAELSSRLAAVGVDSILLKGASIARHLNPPPGPPRHYGDVDLLIEPGGDRRTQRLLTVAGYRLGKRSEHESCWSKPAATPVEPHHTLWGVRAERRRCWQVLYAASEVVALGGGRVRVLQPAALALHIAMHAVAHQGEPKQLDELELALAHWPAEVWSGAHALAVELDAVDAFSLGLSLSTAGEALRRSLGVPASDSVRLALRVGSADTADRLLQQVMQGFSAPRLRDRPQLLWYLLFPRPERLRAYYPDASLLRAYLWIRPRRILARIPAVLRSLRTATRR